MRPDEISLSPSNGGAQIVGNRSEISPDGENTRQYFEAMDVTTASPSGPLADFDRSADKSDSDVETGFTPVKSTKGSWSPRPRAPTPMPQARRAFEQVSGPTRFPSWFSNERVAENDVESISVRKSVDSSRASPQLPPLSQMGDLLDEIFAGLPSHWKDTLRRRMERVNRAPVNSLNTDSTTPINVHVQTDNEDSQPSNTRSSTRPGRILAPASPPSPDRQIATTSRVRSQSPAQPRYTAAQKGKFPRVDIPAPPSGNGITIAPDPDTREGQEAALREFDRQYAMRLQEAEDLDAARAFSAVEALADKDDTDDKGYESLSSAITRQSPVMTRSKTTRFRTPSPIAHRIVSSSKHSRRSSRSTVPQINQASPVPPSKQNLVGTLLYKRLNQPSTYWASSSSAPATTPTPRPKPTATRQNPPSDPPSPSSSSSSSSDSDSDTSTTESNDSDTTKY